MNNLFQEKKNIYIFIVIILFFLLGVLYIYLVMPAKDEASSAEINMNQLKSEMKVLEAQLNKESEEDNGSNTALENQIPLSRSVDTLILALQQLEKNSSSKIENLTFNNYDTDLSNNDQQNNNTDETTEEDSTQSDNQTSDSDQQESTSTSATETISLPNNVKTISVGLTLDSSDFAHFQQFLTGLENLERIIQLNSLSFSIEGENENGSIVTNIEFTIFYYNYGTE